jgi:CHAT domain-containing protein
MSRMSESFLSRFRAAIDRPDSDFQGPIADPHLGLQTPPGNCMICCSPAELIDKKSTLIIVPDRVLWDLPFQALKKPTGSYLIEDHALSYAPSLSVLAQMSKRTKAGPGADPDVATKPPPGLLAFGNPALSNGTVKLAAAFHRDEKLLPLPDAETEVKALARIYPATTYLLGRKPRRESRSQRCRDTVSFTLPRMGCSIITTPCIRT